MKTEEEVLALNNPVYSYNYCIRNKNTANVKAHEKIIIDSKYLNYCIGFARNISNANKQLLSEVVLASGDLYYINLFYNYVDFDKTKYETLMLFI
jgi:hypothetical protein